MPQTTTEPTKSSNQLCAFMHSLRRNLRGIPKVIKTMILGTNLQSNQNMGFRVTQVLLSTRVVKYGIVGCAGTIVNLSTMAVVLTIGTQRGWIPSATATIVATSGNFILHNLWTFSDRQHQGLRLVRGLLSFSLISTMGLFTTTTFYVAFARTAQHFAIVTSHLGALEIALACQLAAIAVGACASYLLNGKFTWPEGNRDLGPGQDLSAAAQRTTE